ncbi:MAG: PaaI family thioesterase [Nocardioides sp.]|uniref:PaaI family thioesterase n=1 Tax=Nocardioides sp. TaxID=35761 RepID=UPI0039E25672
MTTLGANPLEVRAALTDEVRDLVLAAAVTRVEADELAAVRDEVTRLRARLEAAVAERSVRQAFESALDAAAAGEPFRVSQYNAFGIPIAIVIAGETAHAELVADARHEGPPDCVHGGIAAWLMDTMLGLVMQARGRRAVTATLDIRYQRPTPLGALLKLESRVSGAQGRKVWIEGWIEVDDVKTVTAEGLFVELPDGRLKP